MKTPDFTPPPEPPKASPWLGSALVAAIFFVIFVVSPSPMPGGIKQAPGRAHVQMAHAIGLAMFSYANDNNQEYPDGTSSTEVFQKLLDGGYVTDPALFYIPMPGKVKPVPGQKLKPENVSWDVTAPVSSSSSGGLPLFFMTGYKVNYTSGGAAVPRTPFPQYGIYNHPTWYQKLLGEPEVTYAPSTGIAPFYVNNSAAFHPVSADGTIPNFIPPDFKADGTTYRQLTPDGVLP